MKLSWIFKSKQPDVPVVMLEVKAEALTGLAKRLNQKADEVSRRNAKKTYAIDQLAKDITDLGEQFIQKFKETDL